MEHSKLQKYVITILLTLAVIVFVFIWSRSYLLTLLVLFTFMLLQYIAYIINNKINILINFFDELSSSLDNMGDSLRSLYTVSDQIQANINKNQNIINNGARTIEQVYDSTTLLNQNIQQINNYVQKAQTTTTIVESIVENTKEIAEATSCIKEEISEISNISNNSAKILKRLLDITIILEDIQKNNDVNFKQTKHSLNALENKAKEAQKTIISEAQLLADLVEQNSHQINSLDEKANAIVHGISSMTEKSKQIQLYLKNAHDDTSQKVAHIYEEVNHNFQLLTDAKKTIEIIHQGNTLIEVIHQKLESFLSENKSIAKSINQLNKGFDENQAKSLEATATILKKYEQLLIELKQTHEHISHLEAKSIKKIDDNYYQIEALFSIFFSIKPDFPIQSATGWAASANLIKLIMEILFETKPNNTFELGSGLTTVIIGHCHKKIGKGKLIALEHDKQHMERTQVMVNTHKLNDFVTIVFAPLKEYQINGQKWLWYDDNILKTIKTNSIDFLFIDGPPGYLQPLSRYPALPLLQKYIKDSAIAVMDDANRDSEKEIMQKWQDENKNIQYETDKMDKGAFIIRNII